MNRASGGDGVTKEADGLSRPGERTEQRSLISAEKAIRKAGTSQELFKGLKEGLRKGWFLEGPGRD